MKRAVAIIIIFVLLLCFSGCANSLNDRMDFDKFDETNLTNETENSNSGDIDARLIKAEEVFADFLDYYGKDFSCVAKKGIVVLSELEYVVFETIDCDGYSYYVSINENYDIYGAYPNSGMDLIWRNGEPFNSGDVMDEADVPYVSIRFKVLDSSFLGYSNQTGATFFEQTQQGSLAPYYIKKLDSIKYYYGTNEFVIGVNDSGICLVTCMPSNIVGKTTSQIREVINELDAEELFEVFPAVIDVSNSYNTVSFFYWKVDNGYIGFGAIGGDDPMNCYNYVATHFILFEDLSVISSLY